MAITKNAITGPAYAQAVVAREDAAHALYQAELAPARRAPDARRPNGSARRADRLHIAVTRYEDAEALVSALHDHGLAA